jgi:aquaporin Z
LIEAAFGQTWPLQQVWLFLVAPVVGAALAGYAYRYIGGPNIDVDVVGDKPRA